MYKLILIFIVILGLSPLVAQVAQTDMSPLDSLLSLGKLASREGDSETALKLYNEAIRHTIEQNDPTGLSNSIVAKANLFIRQKQIDSVIAVFDYGALQELEMGNTHFEIELRSFKAQSLKLIGHREMAFEEYKSLIPYAASEPRIQSIALQEYGTLQYQMYDRVDSARYYIDKSFIISKELNDSIRLSSILETRGNLHAMLGEQLSAAESYIAAIDYVLPKNIYKKYLLLKGVGLLFKDIGQLDKAREYTNMALSLAVEKNYSRAQAVARNQLGTIIQEQGKPEEALQLFQGAHAYFITKSNYNDIVDVTCNMASLVRGRGQFELAATHLYNVEPKINDVDKAVQIKYWREKGKLLLSQNQPDIALTYLTTAYEIAVIIENVPEENLCLHVLQIAYAKSGNYKMAYETSEAHQYLQDSLIQLRQSQLLFDTEARYQKAEQDKAIAQLNADNEIKDLRITQANRQRIGLFAGLLLLGIISMLIYRTSRIKAANNAALKSKNATIYKALREKETLLKEIHHRVKNNLQVVSSLLTLQSHHMEDESVKEAIQEGRNRVASMGLIHQNLYQEDNLKGIDMQEYFKKLIDNLFHSYNISPDKIRLTSKVDRLNLDVDTVIPLALILNELITNALKYAFSENMQGHLHVELCQHDDALHLLVQDDGIGFPEDVKAQRSDSFGYELIGMFADKLEAEIEILDGKGAGILLKIGNYKIAGEIN